MDFVLLHQAPPESRLWPLFFARAAATVLVFAVAAMSTNLQLSSRTPLRLAVAAAVLDTCANITCCWHPEVAAVAGQHLDLAVPDDDRHPGHHRAARASNRWQALGMVLAALSMSMFAAS